MICTTVCHSWEVTQVYEFLQQLESFRGVVACTTNLWDQLDPAALRRFVFKIPFRYLALREASILFWSALAPMARTASTDVERVHLGHELASMSKLTPGDFAAVRRRAQVIGVDCVSALISWLREEVALKPGSLKAIGFSPEA